MRPLIAFTMTFALLTACVAAQAQTTTTAAATGIDDLLARLRRADANERRAAADSAADARVVSADVLIELTKLLRDDPDHQLRNTASKSRQVLRNRLECEPKSAHRRTVAGRIMAAAETGPTDQRVAAIALLPDYAPDQAPEMLTKLAKATGDDPQVVASVRDAQMLLSQRTERYERWLRGLKSSQPGVVDMAARQLAPSKVEDCIPALRALEGDPAAGLWASLILANWGLSVDRTVAELEPLIDSDRIWVRTAVARALTRSGDAELKLAIESLGHADVDTRLAVADALRARFDLLTEGPARDNSALERQLYASQDRPAFVRGLKQHGLKAAAVYPQLCDMLASARQNPINKPLADAAVVALQDLYRLAAEMEAKGKAASEARTR